MGEQLQYAYLTPMSGILGVARLAVSRLPPCCAPMCDLHKVSRRGTMARRARVRQLYVTLHLGRNGSLLEHWQHNERDVIARRTS